LASGALEQLKKDIALFAFLSAVPAIALAFARELQVHEALDKLLGTRRAVDQRIATLMAELADSSGYGHPERISNDPASAREWFCSYVNQASALRTYVFEVWEGYYVGLYLWLASGISLILCLLLMFILERNIALTFAIVSALIFLAVWAVRRWSTIPKIMQIPVQQIKEIPPSGSVLSEARRRFG
jgi:hypothetical protein